MKMLVTGSNGMLGYAIRDCFGEEGIDYTDIDELDITDTNLARRFAAHKYDVIMHLAAMTDLEFCQRNQQETYMVNTIGTANMVHVARQSKAVFVLISTAGVFDGNKKEPYNEGDHPNPVSHYGMSKLYAEYVAQSYEPSYIIRTTGLFGLGSKGDNKFVGKVLSALKRGEKNIYATNFKGSLTYTKDLAKSLRLMLEQQPAFGVFHVAGKGSPSKLDIAHFILNTTGLDAHVTQVAENYFTKDFSAPRPKHELLDSTAAELFGFCETRDWQTSLEDYIRSVWN